MTEKKKKKKGVQEVPMATLGGRGTYTHTVAMGVKEDVEGAEAKIVSYGKIKSCIEAVRNGKASMAVLPEYNNISGKVDDSLLTLGHDEEIVGVRYLKIKHVLACLPKSNLKLIKTVISKDAALKQCTKLIKKYGWKVLKADSTEEAAKQVSESGDPTVGVICSEEAAEKQGLKTVKREGVANKKNNVTKFIIIKKRGKELNCIIKNAKKEQMKYITSVKIEIRKSKIGELEKLLRVFTENGINLEGLKSEPNLDDDEHKHLSFYIDLYGNENDENVKKALDRISKLTKKVEIIETRVKLNEMAKEEERVYVEEKQEDTLEKTGAVCGRNKLGTRRGA